MSRSREILCYALFSRFPLLAPKQESITLQTDCGDRQCIWQNVHQFQPIMPAQKIETLTVDEFRTAENSLASLAPLFSKLLVNPDKSCPDQLASLIEIRVIRKMSDE